MTDFWETIFGTGPKDVGYVCVELFRNSQPVPGGRKFVEWPKERRKLSSLSQSADKGDLYFRPVLFSSRSVARDAVLGSRVTWADVDSERSQLPPASLAVASGTPGHAHLYWAADRLLTPSETESWNYLNCLLHDADKGGWDITQLLRVPNTKNHKTEPATDVTLEYSDASVWPYPDEAVGIRVPQYKRPDILPNPDTVLEGHVLGDATLRLLRTDDPSDRSANLYRLACLLSEDGLSADEAYVICSSVDEQWGKFTGRFDREQRLQQLIARAFEKQLPILSDSEVEPTKPEVSKKSESGGLQPVGWGQLGVGLEPPKWLIQGILKDAGFMLLGGPAGVGKSQLAIGLCARLVMGAKEWAGFPIHTGDKQQRILYLSLEMDQHGVKYTTDHMSAILPQEQIELLDSNLLFHATLEAFKLDVEPVKGRKVARQHVEEYLYKVGGFTGLVVDTIGASTTKSLQDEATVRSTMTWLKQIRSDFGVWVLILSHPRKEGQEGKRKEITLDDIYGAQVQQAELDTAFILQKIESDRSLVKLNNVKARFGPESEVVYLRRSSNLWLEKSSVVVTSSGKGKAGSDDFDLVDDKFEDDGWS